MPLLNAMLGLCQAYEGGKYWSIALKSIKKNLIHPIKKKIRVMNHIYSIYIFFFTWANDYPKFVLIGGMKPFFSAHNEFKGGTVVMRF